MSKGDQIIEQAAERLRDLSQKAAARGGVGEVLAETLAEDAEFVQKLKPSLIRARLRGENPPVSTGSRAARRPAAPSGPQIAKRLKPPGAGPNPFVVVGAALAVGVALAKLIDWRGHAHPKR